MKMTIARRSGLTWILLCVGISILWGSYLESTSYAGMADFKAVYYGVRSLVHQHDPYNPSQFESDYIAEGGTLPSAPDKLYMVRLGSFTCVNLPTTLLLIAPLALIAWGPAHILWMALTISSLALAGILMWDVAGRYAPRLSLLLVCLSVANIEIFLALGNIAGIAVSLCIIAAWCFMEDRFVAAGVVCMAISLGMKPHVAGLVWLCFVLMGGRFRKRALVSALVVGILAVPAVLWVTHVSPNWIQELQANLLAGSVRGGLNDPGPTSIDFHYADMVISLQSAISIFRDDPKVYNPISYAVSGILLLIGAVWMLKKKVSRGNAWIALASVAALSMLPVYHRLHDAKLLLLALPACALLWAEGGVLKWPAGLITTAALVSTADIPSTILTIFGNRMDGHSTDLWGNLVTVALMRPVAPILLTMGIFYLWVFLRRTAMQQTDPDDLELRSEPTMLASTIR